ncbi:Enoyl-CoA hydratase/carnithine racemase (modular protein) (plasmid) [Methylocella tundrae]|uniref:Enoyl-CoA hydratase/carnithine racemase (Modular protein) n=1 Tax=Methylocella tundrae TaxID=227605 RepID=A0A4U8Z7X3_METTU|nr:enoyl-CoA hydratase-related protein [Methylocella tundrae]VFU16546.1 Enoyl-CoA hydratase/carnithine racemase (modular protein) [Methylocella tundrae]
MNDSVLVCDPDDGVRLLTMSRLGAATPLDKATYVALAAALASARDDASIRVIALTGAGLCFTSGNASPTSRFRRTRATFVALDFLKMLSTFQNLSSRRWKVCLTGIGATLLLHCDLVYAGRGAQFCLPFVPLFGLCPEGAADYLLPRFAGAKRAAELLLLGEPFTAQTAAEAGLINAQTDDGEALSVALANRGARGAAVEAVAATRNLLKRSFALNVAETLEAEAQSFEALRCGPEAQAAFAAFRQMSFASGESFKCGLRADLRLFASQSPLKLRLDEVDDNFATNIVVQKIQRRDDIPAFAARLLLLFLDLAQGGAPAPRS